MVHRRAAKPSLCMNPEQGSGAQEGMQTYQHSIMDWPRWGQRVHMMPCYPAIVFFPCRSPNPHSSFSEQDDCNGMRSYRPWSGCGMYPGTSCLAPLPNLGNCHMVVP
jgi:hypothetical protein